MHVNLHDSAIASHVAWPLVYMFFTMYTLLATFIMVNLFIAVILEGFEETQASGGSSGREGPVVHLAGVIASWVSGNIVNVEADGSRSINLGVRPPFEKTFCDIEYRNDQAFIK